MEFSRQKYWSGLPCPPPGDLPNPGTEPTSLTFPASAGRLRHHRQADRRQAKLAPSAEDVAAEKPVSARVAARLNRVQRAADHKEERDRQQNETDPEFHRGRRFKAATAQNAPKDIEKRRENDDAERVDRLIPSRREGVNRRFLVDVFRFVGEESRLTFFDRVLTAKDI